MSKHTPTTGPWQLARADTERCRVDIETVERGVDLPDQGNHIAVAYWGTPTEEANARLLAAAPELLAACNMALRFLESPGFVDMKERFVPINGDPVQTRAMQRTVANRIEELRAAIAKAEGTP